MTPEEKKDMTPGFLLLKQKAILLLTLPEALFVSAPFPYIFAAMFNINGLV